MTVGGVHEHVAITRLQQALQALFTGRYQLVKARVAVVQRLAGHGFHHFLGNVGGAGCVKESVAGNAFW